MNGFIRPVRLDDAERVASIYNRYVSKTTITFETEPVPVEVMRGRIDSISSAFPYFVYEYDGELIGYCYAHLWKEREAYSKTLETTVYLAPEACHKGIGPLLMTHLIDECRRQGYHALIACITADNLSSLRFHQRLCFRQVSRFSEVGRKFGRWLDVIDLELILCFSVGVLVHHKDILPSLFCQSEDRRIAEYFCKLEKIRLFLGEIIPKGAVISENILILASF